MVESLEGRQMFAATLVVTDNSLPNNDNTVTLATTPLGFVSAQNIHPAEHRHNGS